MDKIYVNITTWKMRDKFLRPMLKHFAKQTLRPNAIILWLSINEYPEIPEHILELKNDGLITAIKLVRKNTFCHKRWEALRCFPDAYNIMIDDDIYYPEDYVETVYGLSKKYHCVSCYWTEEVIFSGITMTKKGFVANRPSHYNRLLSGLTCIPPNIMPITEFFKFRELRDRYVTKCDDSWIKAWLLLKNIKIVGAHDWPGGVPTTIPNTQDSALWRNYNCVKVNGGIRRRICNMATSIDILQKNFHVNIIRGLWPNFDINRCSLYR